MSNNIWDISIDTGGTFTDCIGTSPDGERHRLKILSTSELRGRIIRQINDFSLLCEFKWPTDASIFEGYHFRPLDSESSYIIDDIALDEGVISFKNKIPSLKCTEFTITAYEEVPVLACRILTRTPLTEPLPPINLRLGSTKGTNALLERKGATVIFITTEGFGDLISIGTQQRPELFALDVQKPAPLYQHVIEIAERIDKNGKIIIPITDSTLRKLKHDLSSFTHDTSIAIAFINSYVNQEHEILIQQHLQSLGFTYLSVSSMLSTKIKILPRAQTSVVNAYLLPIIEDYIDSISTRLTEGSFNVMTSSGALVTSEHFAPKDSLLSGPAGGIIGARAIGESIGYQNLITFDMGGTSTDVSVYAEGLTYDYTTKVGDASILSPCLAIETIASGGGSICTIKEGMLSVGPESAGASPGPACYGKHGPLTITDVNLLAGRLVMSSFSIPLNLSDSHAALTNLHQSIARNISHDELIRSYISIANEKMAEAIKKVSVKQGHSLSEFSLVSFGGAGGQHACGIAELLGIQQVIIPYDAGLLSAYGISQANIETFAEKQILQPLDEVDAILERHWEELIEEASTMLIAQGIAPQDIQVKKRLAHLRYHGQDNTVEIDVNSSTDYLQAFKSAYTNIYGHWIENQTLELESIKLIISGTEATIEHSHRSISAYVPEHCNLQNCLTKAGWQETKVYTWETLEPGATLTGPAIIISENTTVYLELGWQFLLDSNNTALVTHQAHHGYLEVSTSEAADLELFKNRFTGVVEEMGAMLEKTSFSVNIKERLDFSCALLDSDGQLIVNAPHIPVHLGSLGICVRKVLETMPIGPGDIIITNHPAYGGSHLPDITLITALYHHDRLVGYLANRAHHAEIGGKAPGSMPADATMLEEEGVIISPSYLARNGEFLWEDIKKILITATYPSRCPEENIADLQGGVASLLIGEKNMTELCDKFSAEKVTRHMQQLKEHVSIRLRQRLASYAGLSFHANELLDDGHHINVSIEFGQSQCIFDFTGTSSTHPTNLNATTAIVNSVVLYVLRVLLDVDLPLNEGLMKDVILKIPEGTLLNPNFSENKKPAVVGGNTEISQRLTDTILKALQLAACSQGTMNNLLFGDDTFGYYETICGGTGAGEGFSGQSAVHQHMTNTRITDPEILEWRYPVRLETFCIRKNSGGQGQYVGGNGVTRQLKFLKPLKLTLLTQHRHVAPYGMAGGGAGLCGEQYLITSKGVKKKLESTVSIEVSEGDTLIIHTPGGGAYGLSR